MAEILNPQDAELEEVILGACLIGARSDADGGRPLASGDVLF